MWICVVDDSCVFNAENESITNRLLSPSVQVLGQVHTVDSGVRGDGDTAARGKTRNEDRVSL